MRAIAKALYDTIVGDSSITDDLATYVFTTGAAAKPAVFLLPNPPAECENPCISIDQVGGVPWGTRDRIGAETQWDVNVWGNRTHDRETLRELAWNTYIVLSRAALTVAGYEELGCIAQPPQALSDPDGFPGFRVGVLVRVLSLT